MGLAIPAVRVATVATHICVCTSTVRNSNWRSEHRSWYLENRFLSAHPFSHKLCASCSKNMCTAAKLRAEINKKNNHNLLIKASPGGSCKPSNRLDFQNSRQILPIKLLPRWEDKFLVLPTLPSSPGCVTLRQSLKPSGSLLPCPWK